MRARCLPASDRAILIELPDLAKTLALFEALQSDRPVGIEEMVPAACTILIEFAPYATTAARIWQHVQRLLARWDAEAQAQAQGSAAAKQALHSRLVEIPVVYDGADLSSLAQLLDIDTTELIARHTGAEYQAAFAGFAPGFVYLAGGHASFDKVPRLPSPRTKVPAGSVAMGGHFSAVYPKDSPGGWQLIGTTPVAMWDLSRAEPALVQPGFRVRFVDVTRASQSTVFLPAKSGAAPAQPPESAAKASTSGSALTIKAAGLQTVFQDLGRLGQTGMGVSVSGALDRQSMRTANRLVGNPTGTAVLENVMGGMHWQCQGSAVLAITGARVAIEVTTAQGQRFQQPQDQAFAVDDGDQVRVGPSTAGLRCYVAVRGGFEVQAVLGSCATDTLAMVGPAAVQAGDAVQVGQAVPANDLHAVQWPAAHAARQWPQAGETVWLDLVLGPRTDWFEPQSLQLLTEQVWEVTAQSNRVGIRLQGAHPLLRQAQYQGVELPSEGTVLGAVQVPANGQPVLFLADHPLTGGYPVVGAVASHHIDLAGQVPPGAQVRFRVVQPFVVEQLNGLEGE
ncbi:5-oxoprolinase/urea amidolyase family protein [Lampropedia aestuarii]|uniref:5-oxoprolinase subunit B/C family protein n=1 Tax=Lampropedia aestuarii TaxID=2562762 RepID=UPI0024690480|nr:5-oxoprolinase/urea amidolyase family protein [Lampropedia aestuarii]MDH5858291.1 5-oxoprolinase/urea amidolyase family protein [Lampropedia aestuarii]